MSVHSPPKGKEVALLFRNKQMKEVSGTCFNIVKQTTLPSPTPCQKNPYVLCRLTFCFKLFFLAEPSAPQNLSTQSINSTAILVSWEQPTSSNGRIKYRLSFGKESDLIASLKLVYDGESTQYLVSNLKPFTRYRFKVNAYNVKYNLSSSFVVAMETTGQAGKFCL